MTTERGVGFTEDRVPIEGIEAAIEELVDMYGGELKASRERERDFTLPLRRGLATGGAVECTVSWAPQDELTGAIRLTCNRDVDAPKLQRVLLLLAGVVGVVLFMLWPFMPHEKEYGTLAWLGGIVAIAVYLMTLRKASGGIAYDFLQRLVKKQRAEVEGESR